MFLREIHGDRILLRLVEADDLEALFQYLQRPEVYEATSAEPWTRESVAEFIRINVEGAAAGAWCRYAIIPASTESPMGDIGFGALDMRNHRAEIGYHLSPGTWGMGFATEAARLLIGWAFENGFNRIEATVMEGNEPSERVLRRLGFTREATLREYKLVRGQYRDFSLWSLLASDC